MQLRSLDYNHGMNYAQLKQWLGNNLWYGEQGGKYKPHPELDFVLVQPDYSSVWGTDISHWDGLVNLSVTKILGASFVIIKAIDGTLPTKYFPENRQTAINVGLITGTYGWLYRNINVSCVAQAQAYTTHRNKYPTDLPAIIDFEPTMWGGKQSNPNFSDLRLWVVEFNRLNGRKPILYSVASYMNQFGEMPADLKAMFEGIHIAHYGVINPAMPLGYASGSWLFHQNYSTGDADIISPNSNNKKEVDLNKVRDLATLERLAGVSIPPPPTGESMRYRVVGANGLNLRSTPFSGSIIILVPPNTYVFGVIDPVSEWLHGTSYEQPGLPETTLDFWCSALPGYIVEDVAPPPANEVIFEPFDLPYRLNGIPYVQPFKPDGLPRKV